MRIDLVEAIILARYTYSQGIDWLLDSEYDDLIDKLKKIDNNHYLLNQMWSDDEIPYDLLFKYGILPNKSHFLNETIYSESFNRDKLLELPEYLKELQKKYEDEIEFCENNFIQIGCRLSKTVQDTQKFFNNFVYPLNISGTIKADGQSVAVIYCGGKFVKAKLRGRNGGSLPQEQVTNIMSYIVPKEIEYKKTIQLNGELVLYDSDLPYLRQKYQKPFKNARNSVSSILSGQLDKNDTKLGHFKIFKVYCEETETLEDGLSLADKLGFETVSHFVKKLENRYDWIDFFNRHQHLRYELPYISDGFVVSVNDNKDFELLGHNDLDWEGSRALKIGIWEAKTYHSKITGIEWSWGKFSITPSIQIEPVDVGGKTVTSIKADHLNRLIDIDFKIGGYVSFKYTSDCYVELNYPSKPTN